MGAAEDQRLLAVVTELKAVLQALSQDGGPAGTTIFTFGDDWTLVFATGDRATQVLEDNRAIFGLEIEDE